MQKVVIVYDIVKNKKRKIVSDLLEGYGIRVNKSVFECRFKNQKEKSALIAELKKEIDPKRDSIRIYTICQNCIATSLELGNNPEPFETEGVYFV
jgi:CRISPR-associated protein Cas2